MNLTQFNCDACRILKAQALIAANSSCPISEGSMCGKEVLDNRLMYLKTTDTRFPEHTSGLSIKCAFNGRESFQVGRHHYAVNDDSYLVLNSGQTYYSSIKSETEVEDFSIFFEAEFANEVLRSCTEPADYLLDEPTGTPSSPLLFLEKTYAYDAAILPLILKLKSYFQPGAVIERGSLEEDFHLLLANLVLVHRLVRQEIERLQSIRRTTRLELYRRLNRAKEYIDSNLSEPLTLKEMAATACLSPNHFLRHFKQSFQVTPHQYLRNKRLERACSLLRSTDLSVTEICLQVGFESPSSFSWLFSRNFGLSPQKLRRKESK